MLSKSIEIFDLIEQGSEEWTRIRSGTATASMFSSILAKGEGKTRKSYLYRLAGEILTGDPAENYSNGYIQRGHSMEDEARQAYAFLNDCEPQQVGFVRNGRTGYSPDSFIGNDGLLEIKTKAPHLMIEVIIADKFPAEHVAQCQGGLWISEREWIDLVCYFPKMPMFVKRAYRDEPYIKKLIQEVAIFNEDLDILVEKIRAYR